MKRIHIEEPGALETIIDWVRHEAVMLQLPSVYTLVAAPTAQGVSQLNLLKNRLSGKNYGTVMGKTDGFLRNARAGAMPRHFSEFDRLEELQGSELARLPELFSSDYVPVGSHILSYCTRWGVESRCHNH